MEKLKSCPFCGGKAEYDGYTTTICKRSIDSHRIECCIETGCGASTGVFFQKKEVIKAWNKRTDAKEEGKK